MRRKFNKTKAIITLSAALVFFAVIITTVFAAYSFKKTVKDEDVIIGNITDVSKSFLSYRKGTIAQTPYSTEYYNEIKVRQNTAYMLEDIRMSEIPTYGNAGNITEFTSGTTYYTLSSGVYTPVDVTVTPTPQNGVTYYIVTATTYAIASVKSAFDNNGTSVVATVASNMITLKDASDNTLAVITNIELSQAGKIVSAIATNGQTGASLVSYRVAVGSDGLSMSLLNDSINMTPAEITAETVTCYASIRNKNESYIDYNKIYLNQLGLKFSFTSEIAVYVRIHIQDAWISERVISANRPKVRYAIKDQISGVSPFYILNDNWYYDAETNIAYLRAIANPGTNSYTFDVNEGYFYHDTSANAANTYTTVEVSFTLDIVQANRARTLWGSEIFDKVYNS